MNHNIYILRTYGPEGRILYKVGYSADVANRVSQYKRSNPFIELVSTHHVSEGIEYERELHKRIKAAFKNEWYSEEQIEYITELVANNELPPENPVGLLQASAKSIRLYCELKDDEVENEFVISLETDPAYECVVRAYKQFGTKKIKALSYRLWAIEEFMRQMSKIEEYHDRIVRLLDLKVGQWESRFEMKMRLHSVYEKLGIELTAKATDVSWFYDLEPRSKSINGVVTGGFVIKGIVQR